MVDRHHIGFLKKKIDSLGIIIQLMQNLEGRSRNTHGHRLHDLIANFENSRWRMSTALNMVTSISLYLGFNSSSFDDICYANAHFDSENGHEQF